MKVRVPTHEKLTQPEAVASIFQAILSAEPPHDQDKEHCWLACLSSKNTIKAIELVSLGTLDASLVHPRDIFRFAIASGSARIAVIHNHPSGDVEPSEDDRLLTARLAEAGKIIGIELLDHIVIGLPDAHCSLKKKGLL
jgi:DNA repair protein RadC